MAEINAGFVLSRLREICLALPDSEEDEKWGHPHFCVNQKIFCGCGEEDGLTTIGVKLRKEHAAAIVQLPGFSVAPYVGRHGWVSLDATMIDDWDHVEALIRESFELVAPRRTLRKLQLPDE